MKSGISIIVNAHSGLAQLDKFFSSFFKYAPTDDYEVILLENFGDGTEKNMVDLYSDRCFIRYIQLDSCVWGARAWNYAASKARYDHLLFTDSEVVFEYDALTLAMEVLGDPEVGVCGARVDGGEGPKVNGVHSRLKISGYEFVQKDGFDSLYPEPVLDQPKPGGPGVVDSQAVSGDFLLCRTEDFQAVGGFDRNLKGYHEDALLCASIKSRLSKQCRCLVAQPLSRTGKGRLPAPQQLDRWKTLDDAYITQTAAVTVQKALAPPANLEVSKVKHDIPLPVQQEEEIPAISRTINVLFLLGRGLDTYAGAQVRSMAEILPTQGIDCLIATQKGGDTIASDSPVRDRILFIPDADEKSVVFEDGRGPDIIHAWTPKDHVRIFMDKLQSLFNCASIIHIDENEEHLTATRVGKTWEELAKLTGKELDELVPINCYHPKRGPALLRKADGITCATESLLRYKQGNSPSMILGPFVDEQVFHPVQVDGGLRSANDIPHDRLIVGFIEDVTEENLEQVRELHRAISLLVEDGIPATLVRMGATTVPLGKESWIKDNVVNFGRVPQDELAEAMSLADLFVFPERVGEYADHSLPVRACQCLAVGRAVILPDSSLARRMTPGVNGMILESGTAEDIAATIKAVADDREALSRMGAAGAMLFSEQIQPEVKKIAAFYRGVNESRVWTTLGGITLNGAQPTYAEGVEKATEKSPVKYPDLWGDSFAQLLVEEISSIQALVPGTQVIPCLETALANGTIPAHTDWVAFVTNVPSRVPQWLSHTEPYRNLKPEEIFTGSWEQVKSRCRGLFVFSEEHAMRLSSKVDVPVHAVKAPLPTAETLWSARDYQCNPVKKIIQSGWWMQRIHGIYLLPEMDMEKVWVTSGGNVPSAVVGAERMQFKSKHILFDFMTESTKAYSSPSWAMFNALVQKNVLFSHHFDAIPLGLLFYAIAHNVPLLVNPYTSIREYLGDDYPLYYYFYKDAAEKAQNPELVCAANHHLKKVALEMAGNRNSFASTICRRIKEGA